MTVYRRRPWSDTWHFVTSCRWWPPLMADKLGVARTVERNKKPRHGEFCNECRARAKKRS